MMAGLSYAAAIYLQSVVGLSPLQVGAWLVPQNPVMLAGTLLAPRLDLRFDTVRPGRRRAARRRLRAAPARRHRHRLARAAPGRDGAGRRRRQRADVAGDEPRHGRRAPERAGSAASLMETCGELGIAMGVATLGTAVTAIYRGLLPGVLPAGTSRASAELATEGVSSAPAAAAQSPDVATQIVYAAQSAFTDGYNVVGVLGGLALIGTALAARRVLGARAAIPTNGELPATATPDLVPAA
ncbi:hypothetical protein [Nocardioides sp. B-3]|uniref:hypothetical protein n=1 Tax=Nocardioides sp. B-3 TaxID=2895565 RepID=UPI0021536B45|nr:hypothetical protein [Nocardioides sp. B-3]UUZ61062.1 hypothetical protein LP418_10605 [Nocardioides sp. B-3]